MMVRSGAVTPTPDGPIAASLCEASSSHSLNRRTSSSDVHSPATSAPARLLMSSAVYGFPATWLSLVGQRRGRRGGPVPVGFGERVDRRCTGGVLQAGRLEDGGPARAVEGDRVAVHADSPVADPSHPDATRRASVAVAVSRSRCM